MPYIIKWGKTNDYIEDPVFSNVTISNDLTEVESADGTFSFVGSYSPCSYIETDQSVLFLGAGNTLYYPQPSKLTDPSAAYDAETNPYVSVTVGSCRAYFQLNGITAGDLTSSEPNAIRSFVLNFGDDSVATGIVEAEANSSLFPLHFRPGTTSVVASLTRSRRPRAYIFTKVKNE